MRFPEQGIGRDQVFSKLAAMRTGDSDKTKGRTFALTFLPGPEAVEVVEEAARLLLWENALDPTAYPSLLRLEQEVIAITAAHLGGDADVCGNFTSGGTESILCAVKGARDLARSKNPGLTGPLEIVLPESAHAAFHKAAHYFDMKIVLVPVDPKTFKPTVEGFRAAVTERTALLVASAPSYAHGVIDPIPAIGAFAAERGLLLHVDACVGGVMLPFFRELGEAVTPFDFSVPGVTSMSVDFHKYGFAAKGSSVVLWKNRGLRAHQLYVCADWTGYAVVNPTVQSSRSGGPLASTWAILHFLGREGYLALARTLVEATRKYREGIAAIEGVEILGKPEMSLLAFATPGLNIFQIADHLAARGWYVQAQLRRGEIPASIHLTVMPNTAPNADAFLADLRDAVAAARATPAATPLAGLAELLGGPDGGSVDIEALLGDMVGGNGLPKEMAAIHDLLDRLPPPARCKLVAAFFNGVSGVQPHA